MTRFPTASRRPRRGFTLVEIMIATVILGLVMMSVFVTFRTGMRAYEAATVSSEKLQTSRYVADIVSRDLRSIFFRHHKEINKNHDAQIAARAAAEYNARTLGQELPEYNPLEEMIRIDLSFKGTPTGLSFVRFQPTRGEMATQPWGLARVDYKFSGSTLTRSEKPIFDLSKANSSGAALPDTSISEVVAENITDFTAHYGFFYDGEWREAPTWQSRSHTYRNPPIDYDTEREDDPLVQTIRHINEAMPFDNLPSYVDIEVTVADPGNEARNITFRHQVALPNAEETYLPVDPNIKMSEGYYGRRELQ